MDSHDQGVAGTAPASQAPEVVFLFPGQGAQAPAMGRGLFETEPVFREVLEECSREFEPLIGESLLDLLYPPRDDEDARAAEALKQTRLAQPAMFSVEIALARLWESRGVRPAFLLGHSLGDFSAACLAGVFTLKGAIEAIAARSRLMQACEPGAMLAVLRSRADVSELLGGANGISLAGVNGPLNCVVAGPAEKIRVFAAACEAQGVETRLLRTSHAFHTEMMRPAVEPFRENLSRIKLELPNIPIISSRTGKQLTAREATNPGFWAEQIIDPVQFHDGLLVLGANPGRVFLEVGPGTTLGSLARQAGLAKTGTVVSSLGHTSDHKSDQHLVAEAADVLRKAGVLHDYPPMFHHDASAPSGSSQMSNPTDNSMSTSQSAAPSRLPRLRSALADVFEEYSGLDVEEAGSEATFLEMGFDSLFLTQIATALQNQFGVPMKFRRMLEDLSTLDRLTAFFDEVLPPEQFASPAASGAVEERPGTVREGAVLSPVAPAGESQPMVQSIMQEQLAIMRQQLALLGATADAVGTMPKELSERFEELQALLTSHEGPGADGSPAALSPIDEPKAFGAQARISTKKESEFTTRQSTCFDAFLERYEAKTGQSKAFTQENRRVMSDPRVVTGFQPMLKELVYPIVVERSSGSRLWDLDGNEYVDLTCGFGSNFLGNQPDFLADAIREQIARGYEVGPQHPLTADVARLIAELTGMERVAFCNTGSEAVMGALRAARTITGRSLVAIFSNSYHGIFDEVIVRGTKKLRSIAAAPGILASAVENVLVLDYGSPESLLILRERGHELAAIMAEPVQSRNPGLQPRDFLHELRDIADDCGAALIFDEVITGFRIAPGGAQEHFGVRADLATYGKIIGGGLPFAAIAGGSRFMDALDGGHWKFGDDSYPEVGVTYFAGTFVRHPLALAAAKASLEHLKQEGPALQRNLNERTTGFVEDLQKLFARTGAPIRVEHFASLFRITVSEDEPFGSLLFYWLRFHGVHIWEGFPTFLTTAHTDEDLEHLHDAFKSSIRELQAGDLLSSASDTVAAAAPVPEDRSSMADAEIAPGDGVPLTDSQREIWHSTQMGTAASCAYNETFTLELQGDLDVQAFKDAVDLVASRHEALRLRFDTETGQQHVADFEPVVLPVHDWREKSDAESRQAMAALLEHEATEPFDLYQGPVIRNALCRLDDSRWVFVTTAHHVVFDGWSAGVYLDEIGTGYSKLRRGEKPDLPPAPGFLDYVRREIDAVQSESGRQAMAYWVDQFQEPPSPLELSLARPRPERRSFRARSLHWTFSDSTYQAARRAAASNDTTLYGFLLAAFGAYLHRLSGQEDIVIGIPTAGQANTGDYGLIGHCVNMLPVKMKVRSEQEFSDHLANTARRLLDAQEHQPATLGSILGQVSVPRDPARPPLVQVVFNLNRKLPEESFEGLSTRNREIGKRFVNWDLFLNCSEEAGGLTTDFDYNADLFDEESMRDFLEGFEHLLNAVSETVTRPVAELPLMDQDSERALIELGQGPVVTGVEVTLPDLIRPAVHRYPDHVAVRWGETAFTYRQLDEISTALAVALSRRGVGRGSGVGVCVSRTPRLPMVLLAVAKCGAFYVPLDPNGATERNAYILEDAGVALVIVDEATRSGLPETRAPVAGLEELLSADPAPGPSRLEPSAGDAAYRLYTSGSTGVPKGVEVSQGALANLLASMRDEPGFEDDDVMLAVATVAFDISQVELFLPLICGGTVIVAPDGAAEDSVELLECLRREGVSVLQATPTHWRMLLESGLEDTAQLRALLGGEALAADLAADLVRQCKAVWNLYGPTETTIYSTGGQLDESVLETGVPIGRPIRNTSVYLLDERQRLVPRGAAGELWIGGAGVANGYPGSPELTAERFRPDPFKPGQRMYRSGDLCRWREDGALEFLHRVDDQLKIRGFRVEPGDVETALRKYHGVREAVVRRWEPSPGDVRLVGYIVPDEGVMVRSGELREFLHDQLPAYMVPQHVVTITEIPRTASGKTDRRALPDPGQAAAPARADESSSRIEQAVREVWQSILGMDRISLNDDFFELGGHSVLAARVVTRLRTELEPALALRHLFEAPTVAQLAVEIENLRFARAGTDDESGRGEELIL
jgi:amino acid adenylation domain-containing protein